MSESAGETRREMSWISTARRGFTVIELLVVIAVIGILIALLLPAVQSAREAARRLHCRNNLKHLALALHGYHDAHDVLPPAATWPNGSNMDAVGNGHFGPNWVILVLPYLEQQSLHDEFDLNRPIPDPLNAVARRTRLATMLCPSDPHNAAPFNGSAHPHVVHYRDGWARGNYGANAGAGFMSAAEHCMHFDGRGCSARPENWRYFKVRGVMTANIACRLAEIEDGTSKTMMLAEIRSGVAEADLRGVWAMEGAGPSAVAAFGFFGDARGPNCAETESDDIAGCEAAQDAVGGDAALANMGMGCYRVGSALPGPNRQCCPRSLHPGGVHIALCDGSVQWISDTIDTRGDPDVVPAVFSVWDCLILSADGRVIANGSF